MRVYKLTDAEGQTYGRMQWGEGITHTASGEGELCNNGWLHAYSHPLLAVFLDPIHSDYLLDGQGLLWEAEADGEVRTDYGLKMGTTRLTTIRRIPVPPVTMEQRVRFGLLCTQAVYREPSWIVWARGWLDGTDRSADAIAEAANATYFVHSAAYNTDITYVIANTEYPADAATHAARTAIYAAGLATGYTVSPAAYAARAAANAAAAAAGELDLIALAEEAVGIIEDANRQERSL